MRYLGLVCVLALAATQAAAQQAGTPMGDLQDLNRLATRPTMTQWSATRPTALSGLSSDSRRWIKAQVQRQVEAPRTPIEVSVAIDMALEKDMRTLAKSERVHPDDVSGAVLLKIMGDARTALALAAWKARKAGAQDGQLWDERIEQARANFKTALELGSSVSLALARD